MIFSNLVRGQGWNVVSLFCEDLRPPVLLFIRIPARGAVAAQPPACERSPHTSGQTNNKVFIVGTTMCARATLTRVHFYYVFS